MAFIVGSGSIGTGWIIFRKRQRKRLQKEQEEKKLLNTQLSSIRSQLNPHFIFNALASLQSLINKADVHKANVYLSQISTLMREALEHSQHTLIALDDEIKMMTHYIEIEQLRTPFHYSIMVDPALSQNQIDVPAMLLQPIIENSIKHAFGTNFNGQLNIEVFSQKTDLHIRIKDNGKGFDQSGVLKKGHGLRLTEERIALFNKLYPQSPIQFTFISKMNEGTTSTFIFNNWIGV